jgi:glycolate oxidase iron-sulfur subunit
MQTDIHSDLRHDSRVSEAESILRRCVHCGFCTATCPTYQLLGDELDGPRGRIYLIKNLLETNDISNQSVTHLDRCLTCRACETSCPSGVEYGRLLDTGRELARERVERPLSWTLASSIIRFVVPRRWLFRPLLRLGQWFRPVLVHVLPQALGAQIPSMKKARGAVTEPGIKGDDQSRVLLLSGCVQSAATPDVVPALKQLLAHKGIAAEIVEEDCCGALDLHLSAHDKARQRMRNLIDRVWPELAMVDGIVSSATGCAVTLKDYPAVLADDPVYRQRAEKLVEKLRDPVELLTELAPATDGLKVAVQTPCSMQHGMRMAFELEDLIRGYGFEVLPQQERHLCCGSAGSYSLLQPEIAGELRDRKLKNLSAGKPDVILTANIGCQLHLESASGVPVRHWLEFVAEQLAAQG